MTTATKVKPVRTGSVTRSVGGFPAGDPATVLGELVSWGIADVEVRHADLTNALAAAGLPPDKARAKRPRDAFARAARRMLDDRIIRKVGEDEEDIVFQFTAERRVDDGFEYDREAVLSLDKVTGEIECDNGAMAAEARRLLAEMMDLRNASDVSRIVHSLFDDKADAGRDLIPILRDGVFFVRREQFDFLDKVERFVTGLGGNMVRLPLAATEKGKEQASKAVAEKMSATIDEFDAAVAAFDAGTGTRSLEAKAQAIRQIRYKIDAYATYLQDEKDAFAARYKGSVDALRAKIMLVGAARAGG